jgi:uncharacterized protein (DUF362 family)/ferredoxin
VTSGSPVSIARCASYDREEVAAALGTTLEPLGGMSAFVSQGQRVFLKVNLLTKAGPERAVTTHPEVVRAVIRSVKACGAADIVVGDSPAGRRSSPAAAQALFDVSHIGPVCREEGVRLALLDDDVTRVSSDTARFYPSFNVGREVVDADVLVNLPKMKTHGFMLFTGAVKNLFGCIPGLEKAQFHVKAPDRADFAEMLVDLLSACRPEVSIMDAVVAMEGDGPSGGTPRHVGALLASADAPALDVAASAIAGFDPAEVYTNNAAARRGLVSLIADDIDVVGVGWRDVFVGDFARPARDVSRHIPPAVARWLRRHASPRPVLGRPSACTGCATCQEICPVEAIAISDGAPRFDHDLCIRCYCCQELCLACAIELRTPWLFRATLGRESERGS